MFRNGSRGIMQVFFSTQLNYCILIFGSDSGKALKNAALLGGSVTLKELVIVWVTLPNKVAVFFP